MVRSLSDWDHAVWPTASGTLTSGWMRVRDAPARLKSRLHPARAAHASARQHRSHRQPYERCVIKKQRAPDTALAVWRRGRLTRLRIASVPLLDHHLNRCKGARATAHATLRAALPSVQNAAAVGNAIAAMLAAKRHSARKNGPADTRYRTRYDQSKITVTNQRATRAILATEPRL